MIVIHIESGLGNQMLSYCEYLSLKYANPSQVFYIETLVYEFPECNDYINQWNGYELEHVFGIHSPKNIRTLFSEQEWSKIKEEIRATEFWRHNWNYPVAFTNVLNKHGLNLENVRGNFDPCNNIITGTEEQRKTYLESFRSSRLGYLLQLSIHKAFEKRLSFRLDYRDKLFSKYDSDVFTGQWLKLNYKGNNRELIETEMRRTFIFPPICDDKNAKMASFLRSVNAVAIHARRGDMSGSLAWCYKYGYFKRAVKYIKKQIENPVFVFFTNPGGMEWCRENANIFGMDLQKDSVEYVDWNKGEESFRDMQLIGLCKHAIITPSSFGWWGAWFIENPEKITIAPRVELDTTHFC